MFILLNFNYILPCFFKNMTYFENNTYYDFPTLKIRPVKI